MCKKFKLRLLFAFCVYLLCHDSHSSSYVKNFYDEVVGSQYEVVSLSDTREWDVINRNLHPNKWPILPTSYRYEERGSKWIITKHRDAPEANVAFFAFGSDEKDKINYVVQAYGQTTYSYTHTRNPAYDGKRNQFAFINSTNPNETFLDGHCGDHADTPEELLNFYHTISTHHGANRIPEPEDTYWGKTLRNHLVKDFRKYGNGYSQWVFYPNTRIRTQLSQDVPSGVLFLNHNGSDGKIQTGWSIPWKDPIHGLSGQGCSPLNTLQRYSLNWWSKKASKKDLIISRKPLQSFVYRKDQVDPQFMRAFALPTAVSNPYEKLSLYRMETMADSEHVPLWALKAFEFYLISNYDHNKAQYFGDRLSEYMLNLQINDFDDALDYVVDDESVAQIVKHIRQKEDFDLDHMLEDKMRQVLISSPLDLMHSERSGSDLRHLFNDFEYASPEKKQEFIRPPSVVIEMNSGKGSLESLKNALSPDTFKQKRTIRINLNTTSKISTTKDINTLFEYNKKLFDDNYENIECVELSGTTGMLSDTAKTTLHNEFGGNKVRYIKNALTPETAGHVPIITSAENAYIRDLDLLADNTKPTDECDENAIIESIEGIRDIYRNRQVNSRFSVLNIDGCELLGKALRVNTSLRKLAVRDINDDGVVILVEAFGMSADLSLIELDLEVNRIGDTGACAIAKMLGTNSTLKTLTFRHCGNISNKGACKLAEALKTNTTLLSLNLAHNKVGVEGARAFSQTLRVNRILEELYLYGNASIGAEGVLLLQKALHVNAALRVLNLNGCA